VDVYVDEARRHHQASRIDHVAGGRIFQMIDRRDTAARDSDVKAPARRTGAVDDVAAHEENVKVHWL